MTEQKHEAEAQSGALLLLAVLVILAIVVTLIPLLRDRRITTVHEGVVVGFSWVRVAQEQERQCGFLVRTPCDDSRRVQTVRWVDTFRHRTEGSGRNPHWYSATLPEAKRLVIGNELYYVQLQTQQGVELVSIPQNIWSEIPDVGSSIRITQNENGVKVDRLGE